MTLALLEREIWRLSGSDWQLKLLASTVTSQLPVNCKRIRVSEWFSISRVRVSGCEFLYRLESERASERKMRSSLAP